MTRRRRRKIGKYGARPIAKRTIETNAKGLVRKNPRLESVKQEAAKDTGKKANSKKDDVATRPVFSREDKRYMMAFLGISIAITALYWFIGGRNLFVFPAVFLLSVGTSRFWKGPVRRFAEGASNKVSDKKAQVAAKAEKTASVVNEA